MGNLVKLPLSELVSTLEALSHHGVRDDHFARLRSETEYAKRVAEFMLRGGLTGSVHEKLARVLMGKNFFGVEEWALMYDARFTKKQLREVAEFPWGEEVLNSTCPFCKKAVKECHMAFLGLSKLNGGRLTLAKLLELHPPSGQPRFYFAGERETWHREQRWAIDATCTFRWYLMHTEIVPGSGSNTFDEQRAMLPTEYEIPNAIEESVKDILVFKKVGLYANPNRYARTTDVTHSDSRGTVAGFRVVVGYFGSKGLFVCPCGRGGRRSGLGAGASRKIPN